MFKFKIIAIGRQKDQCLGALGREFAKRISPYAKLEEVELKGEPFGKNADFGRIKEAEGETILKHLENNAEEPYVIALERTGRELSSEYFAREIGERGQAGREIAFVIGGALGLSDKVLSAADAKISLSKMTFTHFMARLFLLEQIYRALTILEEKKYHY